MVMEAVQAICQFCPHISQQSYSDLSLKVLNNEVNQFYWKQGANQELKVLQFAKAQVDEQFATESYQLSKQIIHWIYTAVVAHQYEADKVATTKHRQF